MRDYEPATLSLDALDAFLYDRLNPWGGSDDFFLDLVMRAESVLDVGCGTGSILRRARAEGHAGRLVGLDPDPNMLDQAREHDVAEWVETTVADARLPEEFDLVIMSGNAFQCLTDDVELRESLDQIRWMTKDGGRFAFDTRNPVVAEWREWNPENPYELEDPAGATLRFHHDAGEPDEHGVVKTRSVCEGPHWDEPLTSTWPLRFIGVEALDRHLETSGFTVAERFGDWNRGPFDPEASRSIITIARTA
jgi:SAM-dependent methyltransferase